MLPGSPPGRHESAWQQAVVSAQLVGPVHASRLFVCQTYRVAISTSGDHAKWQTGLSFLRTARLKSLQFELELIGATKVACGKGGRWHAVMALLQRITSEPEQCERKVPRMQPTLCHVRWLSSRRFGCTFLR